MAWQIHYSNWGTHHEGKLIDVLVEGYSVDRTGYLDWAEGEVREVKGRRSTSPEVVPSDERGARFTGGRATVWDKTTLRSHHCFHWLRAPEIPGFCFCFTYCLGFTMLLFHFVSLFLNELRKSQVSFSVFAYCLGFTVLLFHFISLFLPVCLKFKSARKSLIYFMQSVVARISSAMAAWFLQFICVLWTYRLRLLCAH